jgi:methionine biosynthesis protein MetW
MNAPLRPDLQLICEWIAPGSHILDLGCGDGELLAHLHRNRGVTGYGLEIDAEKVAACVAADVHVIQADVDEGLADFSTHSFDYVVMTQALQALVRPDHVLQEMLRVGGVAIVTFPNFGHWRARMAMLRGRMPVVPALPFHWYDSPNIHVCTVADFEALCEARGWPVTRRALVDRGLKSPRTLRWWPNLMTEIALYQLGPLPQNPEAAAPKA